MSSTGHRVMGREKDKGGFYRQKLIDFLWTISGEVNGIVAIFKRQYLSLCYMLNGTPCNILMAIWHAPVHADNQSSKPNCFVTF